MSKEVFETDFTKTADELERFAKRLRDAEINHSEVLLVDRRLPQPQPEPYPQVLNLYVDTHYGDDIFQTLKTWQQFPVFQRNLLIIIARNYVEHPIDGNSETPFATNRQTDAYLPEFYGDDAPAIAAVLDGLVAKMRGELKTA